MQPSVDHRPVYGSSEKDEFICSCGWSGATAELPGHYEEAAEAAWSAIQAFAALLEDHDAGPNWDALTELQDERAYLSPEQFVAAMRNQNLKRGGS